MGETKRHHYVPRCYLKYFSNDGTNINTFIIGENKMPNPITMKGVCVQKNFYTLGEAEALNAGVNENYIEKDFFEKQVEPQLDRTIRLFEGLKIAIEKHGSSGGFELPVENQRIIAQLILIQYFRVPRARNEVINKLSEYLSVKELADIDKVAAHASYTFLNEPFIKSLVDKLMSDYWIVRIHPGGDFYTSDNPVVVIDNGKLSNGIWDVKARIGATNTAIFYPLTNEMVLEIYDAVGFPEVALVNNTVQFSNEEYTRKLNTYQYLNAEKFVISKDGKFDLFIRQIK